MENPFLNRPEFIEKDNRKNRYWNPTNYFTLYTRFSKMLPPDILKDKTVLDLGSCIGAAGFWCTYFGAKHYTGVEIQDKYFDTMSELLQGEQYTLIKQDIIEFFETNTKTYDIVILSGVLYAFLDYYSILKGCTNICNEYLCLDIASTSGKNIEIDTVVINSDQDGSYKGVSCRISPFALDIIMSSLNFYNTKRDTTIDNYKIYDETRAISIYSKSEQFMFNIQDKIKMKAIPDIKW